MLLQTGAIADPVDGWPTAPAAFGPTQLLGPGDQPPRLLAEPPERLRGAVLGRYLVLERLGAGGMGVVYAAYDPELDRKVAIKLLRGEVNGASGARLQREARAMARLTHPNVIAVHDVGEVDGQIYVAMEFVDGPTLRAWQERTERPWPEIVDMYLQAGRGLAAAHRAGLVHRDFKPDNALVDADGRVRVLDFGLARTVEGEPDAPGTAPAPARPGDIHSRLTQEGSIVGTPAYMAPEQRLALPVDARCDQFSFCVALWEALAGDLPFDAPNQLALLAAVREQRTEPIPRERGVPAWLVRALLRGLRAAPDERFPDMDALLVALARDPARTRRRALAGLGLAGALAAGLFAMSSRPDEPGRCGGAAQQSAGVWDHEQKAAARAAFRATGQPYAEQAFVGASRRLDARLTAWRAMYTDACAATQIRGEQSPDLMDRRMTCLQELLAETRALTRAFAAADAGVVERAVQATDDLRGIEACADLRALTAEDRSADPAHRGESDALRLRLAEAWGAWAAGRYDTAGALADVIVRDADALGACGPAAEARALAGQSACRMGQAVPGSATLEDAVWRGTACRNDEAVVAATLALVYCVGIRQARPLDAEPWARHADAALTRLGGAREGQRRAALLGYRGLIAFDAGHYAEARALQEQSVALAERTMTADSWRLAPLLGYLGVTLERLGELDEALALQQRSRALLEPAFGRDHPMVAVTYNNIGNLLAGLGKHEEALAYHERDLAISLRALGPLHPDTALSFINHAALLSELGRFHESLAELARARQILETIGAREHPDYVLVLNNIGLTSSYLGFDEEARAALEEAKALSLKQHDGDHLDGVYADLVLAQLDLRAGRLAEALARAEHARDVRARTLGGDHDETHEAEWRIGALLARAGRCAEARPRLAAARTTLEARLRPQHMGLRLLGWVDALCGDEATVAAAGESARRERGPADLRGEVLVRAAELAWSKGQAELSRETAAAALQVLDRTGPALAPLRARAARLVRTR